jgi:hypothetical protein
MFTAIAALESASPRVRPRGAQHSTEPPPHRSPLASSRLPWDRMSTLPTSEETATLSLYLRRRSLASARLHPLPSRPFLLLLRARRLDGQGRCLLAALAAFGIAFTSALAVADLLPTLLFPRPTAGFPAILPS